MSRTIGNHPEESVLLTDRGSAGPSTAVQRGSERFGDRRRGLKGLLLGLAVVALLAVLRMSAPQSLAAGMSDSAKDFVTLAVSVLIESLPFVFLGIFLSVVVQVWLPEGFLLRHLPRRGGHPAPGAAQAVRRAPGVRRELHALHRAGYRGAFATRRSTERKTGG